jgi:hypothetical protein
MDKDKLLAVAVCSVCRLIIKPTEPIKKMGGHPVHVACVSPLTVTCAIAGGLLKVRVMGNYDFEDVKRAITAALDQAEVGSAQAIVYDMRAAGFQP